MCRISSADCFHQWIHSLAEPTTSPAKYSGLHFAQYSKFCSAFASKVFLYDIHWKTLLKIHFQLVSNFIFLPPSFCFTFSFCSYESTKDKLSLYLYWKVSISLRGCFAKVFYPLTIIGKLRAVCRGISRKFLYFFFRNIENLIPPQNRNKKADDCLPSTINNFICFYNK